MKERQKLPIGIQNFESLRRDGYLYVDKTECIYRLISEGRYYFLSRPRRFGKSLLLSTIQALYEGKKELFDGTIGKRLYIADKEDIDWEAHPVLHLDLNTEKYDAKEKLEGTAEEAMEQIKDKSYSLPFEVEGQQIIRIGMNFSNKTRNIKKYIVE